MDKVKAFLEKYVQWVALGIGVVFLGLMAYQYVVQQPVAVPVAGQPLPPHGVDAAVAADPDVTRLKKELTGTVPQDFNPPEVPPATVVLADTLFKPIVPPEQIAKAPGPVAPPPGPTSGQAATQLALLKAPSAVPLAGSHGRGVYQWTPRVPPPPPPAPGAVVPPAVAAQPQPVWRDLDWTSHLFEISTADLVKAYTAAGLSLNDPIRSRTEFLSVELLRQEKQPDDKWGPTATIPVLPEFQAVIPPLPKPEAPDQEKFAFLQLIAPNVQFVVQPTFPQMLAGTPWVAPAPPVVPGAGNPAAGPGGFQPGGGGFQPPVPPPNVFAQPGGEGGPAGGGTPYQPGQVPGSGNPDGTFLPAEMLASVPPGQDVKVSVLAHDITAAAGKTYRYAIRYALRNPLWGTGVGGNLPAAVAGPLAVVSPDSGWTKEVTIAPRVEFFASRVKPRGAGQLQDEVELEVFVDQNGQWKQLKAGAPATTFNPGDPIAQPPAGAQQPGWNSGWSVVDIRKDPRNRTKTFLVVADANGKVERRDVDADQKSDRLLELRTLVGAVQPGAPGTPAPGMEGAPPRGEFRGGRPPIGGGV